MLKKILKNSSYLVAAQLITKIFAFIYGLFLAGSLGVENFGLYSVALSYFSLISSFADFGVSRYLIREVAKDEHNTARLFTNALLARLGLLSGIFGIFALFMVLLDPNNLRVSLTVLAMVTAFPQAIGLTLDAVFVARQRLSVSAYGLLVLNIVNFCLGYLLVVSGMNAYGAIIAVIVAHGIFAFFLYLYVAKEKLFSTLLVSKRLMISILKGSYMYGLLGILGLVYFKVDNVLLGYLKGSYEAGIYGFAYRFLEALLFVPSAVETALFPVIAKMYHLQSGGSYKLYKKSLLFMFLVSVPVVLMFTFFVPSFITAVRPEYRDSTIAIRILALTIPFVFMLAPQGGILLATERYLKPLFWIALVNLIINVAGNLILIPQYGYIAASWMTVISHVITFVVYYLLIKFTVGRDND